ncbi:MAG: hypothetical protein ACYSU0_21760 [Planctomycetota bacterium]|jgi:hypothetical protein
MLSAQGRFKEAVAEAYNAHLRPDEGPCATALYVFIIGPGPGRPKITIESTGRRDGKFEVRYGPGDDEWT